MSLAGKKLVILKDDRQYGVYETKEPNITIGGSIANDVRIKLPEADPFMCKIELDAFGRANLINLSGKPIFVNGTKIKQKVYLKDGDTIKVLNKQFQWMDGSVVQNKNDTESLFKSTGQPKILSSTVPSQKTKVKSKINSVLSKCSKRITFHSLNPNETDEKPCCPIIIDSINSEMFYAEKENSVQEADCNLNLSGTMIVSFVSSHDISKQEKSISREENSILDNTSTEISNKSSMYLFDLNTQSPNRRSQTFPIKRLSEASDKNDSTRIENSSFLHEKSVATVKDIFLYKTPGRILIDQKKDTFIDDSKEFTPKIVEDQKDDSLIVIENLQSNCTSDLLQKSWINTVMNLNSTTQAPMINNSKTQILSERYSNITNVSVQANDSLCKASLDVEESSENKRPSMSVENNVSSNISQCAEMNKIEATGTPLNFLKQSLNKPSPMNKPCTEVTEASISENEDIKLVYSRPRRSNAQKACLKNMTTVSSQVNDSLYKARESLVLEESSEKKRPSINVENNVENNVSNVSQCIEKTKIETTATPQFKTKIDGSHSTPINFLRLSLNKPSPVNKNCPETPICEKEETTQVSSRARRANAKKVCYAESVLRKNLIEDIKNQSIVKLNESVSQKAGKKPDEPAENQSTAKIDESVSQKPGKRGRKATKPDEPTEDQVTDKIDESVSQKPGKRGRKATKPDEPTEDQINDKIDESVSQKSGKRGRKATKPDEPTEDPITNKIDESVCQKSGSPRKRGRNATKPDEPTTDQLTAEIDKSVSQKPGTRGKRGKKPDEPAENQSTAKIDDSVNQTAVPQRKRGKRATKKEDPTEDQSIAKINESVSRKAGTRGKRGKKPDEPTEDQFTEKIDESVNQKADSQTIKGKRGKKPEKPTEDQVTAKVDESVSQKAGSPRKRGRKGAKKEDPTENQSIAKIDESVSQTAVPQTKRGKKNTKPEEPTEDQLKPKIDESVSQKPGTRGKRGKKLDDPSEDQITEKIDESISQKPGKRGRKATKPDAPTEDQSTPETYESDNQKVDSQTKRGTKKDNPTKNIEDSVSTNTKRRRKSNSDKDTQNVTMTDVPKSPHEEKEINETEGKSNSPKKPKTNKAESNVKTTTKRSRRKKGEEEESKNEAQVPDEEQPVNEPERIVTRSLRPRKK